MIVSSGPPQQDTIQDAPNPPGNRQHPHQQAHLDDQHQNQVIFGGGTKIVIS